MPKTAIIEMTIILNDDVSLETRAQWAAHTPSVLYTLMEMIDAKCIVRLGISKEERDAIEKYINECGDEKLLERFVKAVEASQSTEEAAEEMMKKKKRAQDKASTKPTTH
jgi:hypothetical protein